jgi:cob(I)alamin adenosyltransferase
VKIYTRTGDDGTTGLLGPGRVSKADARIEAYGTVDELNAAIGAVRALDTEHWLESGLASVQANLFQIGAELAAEEASALSKLDPIRDTDVESLEGWIDRLEADLPALKRFILPGGTALAASLHVARTVCRRAERRVVALSLAHSIEPRLVRYLNRLADALFVLARWCNRKAGAPEHEWPQG